MPATDPHFDHADEDLWVFAYGSLMWRPGFEARERVPARLIGAHRALCVWSHVHRGSPERPGLDYLRAREQVTMVYRECVRPVVLLSHPERRVQAVCYLVDRSHPQYAGRLKLAEQLHHVRQGHGISGQNREYVLAAVKELEALGCRDRDLHMLAERLHGVHEAHTAS